MIKNNIGIEMKLPGKHWLYELYKVLGFGALSLLLSKLQFVVPGAVGGLSDMREIALVIALFYFRYWPSIIIVSAITAFGLHDGGSYLATFTMHAIGLIPIYYAYNFYNRKYSNRLKLVGIWIIVILFYFYVLLIPIMGFLHYFLGIIEMNQYLSKCVEITRDIRLEVIVTTLITSIYLLYLKTTEILEIQNRNLFKSMQKAEESEQLKTAFLQNLSHEIRTPLNGIMGFSRLLQQVSCENEQTQIYTKHIVESGDQLLNIVNDVVDASQIETNQSKLNIAERSIKQIFEEVKRALESKGEEQVQRIEFKLNGCEGKTIESDAYKLMRINYHLLENALKFSKENVLVGCSLNSGMMKISVADKGIGIAEDNKEEIFKKFRQVDRVLTRDYGGNGLGLAIVKGFVADLGGKVWFESELGTGTTFFFEIPVN